MSDYYHMQMHPNEPYCAIEYAREGVKCMGAIGLDFGLGGHPLDDRPLDQWTDEDFQGAMEIHKTHHGSAGVTASLSAFMSMKVGDIVLLRGGATPVALVKVTGPYYMAHDAKTHPGNPECANKEEVFWDWPRHRFPVEILGWYEDDRERCGLTTIDPAMGTFRRAAGPESQVYEMIQRWLDCMNGGGERAHGSRE